MNIIDIISIIGAFFLGYMYREFILIKDLMKVSKNLQEKVIQRKEAEESMNIKQMHKLKHEVVNDIHYFYLEETNNFVCQGETLEDAAKHYTLSQGKDTLGWFFHQQTNTILCFNDDQCMEFKPDAL